MINIIYHTKDLEMQFGNTIFQQIFFALLYVCHIFVKVIMPEKQFVKAKPLQGPKAKGGGEVGSQQRQSRKTAKKYEQKVHLKDNRDGIKLMIAAYRQVNKNDLIVELQKKHPKLFMDKPVKPEQEGNFNFNDCLRGAIKKQPYSRYTKQLSSDSSEPDWNSDCEKQVKLESKKIDESVIQRIQDRIKKQPAKRLDDLQRHQKQFLQDYYRQKRNIQADKQAMKENNNSNQEIKQENESKKKLAAKDDWNEYTPQVDALITEGFLQKIDIQQEGDDFQLEDDFSFEEQKPDEKQKVQSKSSSSSAQSDGDDMFTDDKPRFITEKKAKQQKLKNTTLKGTVCINNHLFSQIAESIGIHPETCTWIISNKAQRYKLTTHYMNTMYRQKQLYKTFPYISLNHSQFVKNEDIETEKGLQKFKRFNERKLQQQNKNNYQTNRGGGGGSSGGGKKQIIYKPRK